MSEETVSGPDVPPDRLAINPRSRLFRCRQAAARRRHPLQGRGAHQCRGILHFRGLGAGPGGQDDGPHGQPLTIRLNGPVEAWYEDLGEDRARRQGGLNLKARGGYQPIRAMIRSPIGSSLPRGRFAGTGRAFSFSPFFLASLDR
jgi:hypothetical protein